MSRGSSTRRPDGLDGRLLDGRLIAAWSLAGAGHLFFALGAAVPPTSGVALAELAGFALLGVLHGVVTRGRGRVVWPGLLLVAIAGVSLAIDRLGPTRAALVPLGVGAVGFLFARLTGRRAWALALWTLTLPPLARLLVLTRAEVDAPLRRLGDDVRWPVGRIVGAGSADPPVIVVTVDTLRADHVEKMESWAWLAERGATWERAMSTSSWTLPALASVWTGRLPGEHGCGLDTERRFQAVSEGVPWLAEQLKTRGAATAAFVVNPFISSDLGFRRGFSRWWTPTERVAEPLLLARWGSPPPARDAEVVVDAALGWLDSAPESGLLLWVHLFDPHLPYRHSASDSPSRAVQSPVLVRKGEIGAGPAVRAAARADYAGEVAYTDRQLLRLLQGIDARGLLDSGTLVFTADHGEEFWDHGRFEHGHSHHGEVVDVPLALISPGVAAGPRAGVASLIDIASTLRAILGLPFEGIDLRGGVPDGRTAAAVGNLYGAVQRSVRSETHRLIFTDGRAGRGQARAYELTTDPQELLPLPVEEGHPLLSTARGLRTPRDGRTPRLHRGELEALGYIDGGD